MEAKTCFLKTVFWFSTFSNNEGLQVRTTIRIPTKEDFLYFSLPWHAAPFML